MRRVKLGIAIGLIGALTAFVAGCGGSDPEAAQTPSNAPTITNGKPPADEVPSGQSTNEGDVGAEGKIIFETSCQGCHPAGGTEAGAGPVLADRGLVEAAIKTQIVNGKGAMPGGLVTGGDLDKVVAFVVGLQGAAAAGGGESGGDAVAIAAGKTFYETTCQGCHPAGGTQAGAGPVLAGKGLTADAITTQITTPAGTMPAGLASGADLENVTAFLQSLQ